MYSRDTSSGWLVASEMERKQKALRLNKQGLQLKLRYLRKKKNKPGLVVQTCDLAT